MRFAEAPPAHPFPDSANLCGAPTMCQAWAEYQGSTVNKTDNSPCPEEGDILRKETDIKHIYNMMASQEEKRKGLG